MTKRFDPAKCKKCNGSGMAPHAITGESELCHQCIGVGYFCSIWVIKELLEVLRVARLMISELDQYPARKAWGGNEFEVFKKAVAELDQAHGTEG